MQESPEDILGGAIALVGNLEKGILVDLSSAQRKKRQEAVNAILKKLNPQANPEDSTILQSLPIALIASREHIGTMYFMLICIENGAFFDPKIIDAVIGAVAIERIQCSDDGDIEAAGVITHVLHSLYNGILKDPKYKQTPEIYLSIGMDQERRKDTLSAIGLYKEAMGLGSIDAYMYLGDAYESKSRYDMSTNIFSRAYQLSGETRFLHRLIHALCKAGRRQEAYERYLELQNTEDKQTVNPFIVYLEDVHNDSDLDAVSQLMTDYCLEGTLEPRPELATLARNSSVYIANEIEKESTIMGALNEVSLDVWTDEHDSEYWRAISRRLYLMQTHIITLADPRYLEFYIDEMRRYTVDGNTRTQEMVRRFFTDSFSPYVLASYRQITVWDTISDMEQEGSLSREERRSYQQYITELGNTVPSELYESMRLHLVQISAIFSQFSYYDYIRDTIVPFIEACLDQEGELDEEVELFHGNMIQELKNELDEYDRCSPVTRRFYEEYIAYFDKKYGMFYRRYLQLIVRDGDSIPAALGREYEQVFAANGKNHLMARDTVLSNMGVLLEYPDVALLFLIEKIIAGQDIVREDEAIDMIVEKYQLHSLIERDAILFAALLYERGDSYDDAMAYITCIPDILDVPQVLSMLTKWLRYIDDAVYPKAIKSLNQLAREEYDAKNFFEQIQTIADDILSMDNESGSDKAYMLMAMAHMQVIRKKNTNQAKIGLNTAGELGLSLGYIASGDISQELGDFDEATQLFQLAYLSQSDNVSIRRLISCLIEAARFDEAQSYIEIALRERYDISGCIFSWHLYQGQVRLAIEQMVRMVQSDGDMDMKMTEDCTGFLCDMIDQVLGDTTNTRDTDSLKILASYIDISMDIDSDEPDPVNIISHMDYIQSLMNSYEGDDLIDALYHTLSILVSDIDLDHKKSNIDALTGLLHLHYTKLHRILEKIHIKNQNKKDTDGIKYSFGKINELIGQAILTLERFPDTDEYLRIWRGGLNLLPTQHHLDKTIHSMRETLQ